MSLEEKTPLLKSVEQSEVGLQRHITLVDCVGIIIGNVIGSGIFISPQGVVANIGSVGGTLIIWVLMGLCALAQALCYAELGAAIPLSGGDYAYVYGVLGPMPAFLCAWTQVVIAAPSTNAVISRTAGIYLTQTLNLNCHPTLLLLIAYWILVTFAAVNSYSSKLGTWVQVIFSVAKVAALCTISITGIVFLVGKGYTENFAPGKLFEGTVTDPGLIGLSALNGYFAYKGWELVNTLPEEMVNPTRDLPYSVWIAMLTCTVIYTLTNIAYFTVMSPSEILESGAVALTFIEKTIGKEAGFIISLSVALSCMGTINGSFLSDTRYLFAAGRNKQFPSVFSMIQINTFTPIAAMIVLCTMSMMYALIPNVETLTSYTSLAVQLKILLSFIALFYLRWKAPDLHRPVKAKNTNISFWGFSLLEMLKVSFLLLTYPKVVKVNIVLAAGTFIFMLVMIGLAMTEDPVTIGLGVALFFLGVPVYFITRWLRHTKPVIRFMDVVTIATQSVLYVAPESDR